jgi:acyl-CoA thioesterase-1
MLRRNFLKVSATGVVVSLLPQMLFSKTKPELPNIMLIGDSVSLGYTNYVKEALKGKVNFFRPLNSKGGYDNCAGTTKGVQLIDKWLALSDKWDVIHFNFGLHDLKHVDPITGKNSTKEEDPQQADLKTYKKNLKLIVKKLKATNAKLIFATTTSYPDKPGGPLRRADQPEKYNAVALKIMKKNDIEINHLNTLTRYRLDKLQPPNNVHFTKEGSKVLGKQVVEKILAAL